MKRFILFSLFNIMAALAYMALFELLDWSGLLRRFNFYGSAFEECFSVGMFLAFFVASSVASRLYYRVTWYGSLPVAVCSAIAWMGIYYLWLLSTVSL